MSTVYDPRFHTWNSWASLMVEAYGSQNLEIPGDEEEWKGWAAGFCGISLFAKDAAPDPYTFDDWRDWAAALVNNISTAST